MTIMLPRGNPMIVFYDPIANNHVWIFQTLRIEKGLYGDRKMIIYELSEDDLLNHLVLYTQKWNTRDDKPYYTIEVGEDLVWSLLRPLDFDDVLDRLRYIDPETFNENLRRDNPNMTARQLDSIVG